MIKATVTPSEKLVENMEDWLFKSEADPPFHGRESIEGKLAILFARESR